MQYNIVIAGVGGQGILTIATIIAKAAMAQGFYVRQSEIHGMSQRGGNVSASVRISDSPIPSDIIPDGSADMILSMEPLESLRYLYMLKEQGVLLTAKTPVENIPDYNDLDNIYTHINDVDKSIIIDADAIAKEAGSTKAVNLALVGAAAPHLPIKKEFLEQAVKELFAKKGEAVISANLKALAIGKENTAVVSEAGEKERAGTGLKM